ncbi:hypothetical protein ATK36_3589 [Amycolatopsis sulphurea]|uniref:Uncharacterized protein n=1 Tax=Amycolatopsis sulphurea TaxID=76022 RepID=A0A2A9FCI9_9PSEU|nr:hypothetical protein [Amycolatopsis sulphurea]PFG48496.1 hypothetical protein ATK36_3589 [Amycolatopsis sulphurea]
MGKHTKRMPGCLPRVAVGAAPLALLVVGTATVWAEPSRMGIPLDLPHSGFDQASRMYDQSVTHEMYLGEQLHQDPSATHRPRLGTRPFSGDALHPAWTAAGTTDTGRFTGDLRDVLAAAAEPVTGRFTGTLDLPTDRQFVSGDLGLLAAAEPPRSFRGQFTLDELASTWADTAPDPVPTQSQPARALGHQLLDDDWGVSRVTVGPA